MAVGMPEVKGFPPAVDLAKNPLAETHEFKQACSICYVKTGEELFLTVQLCVVSGKVQSNGCFYPQDPVCWITHFIQKSINAKKMLYLAESNTCQTKRGSSFGPDQQKPNTLDLITFAKVTFRNV